MSDYSSVSFKNNGKLKLLIIVGTRPEIIRLAAVINKTRKYFDVILAHTGQNYDYNLNGVFFHDLELADPEVYMNAVGADLGVGLCDEADGVHHFFEHGCALLYCFTSCGGFPRLLPNYRLYTRRARRTRRFSLLNC